MDKLGLKQLLPGLMILVLGCEQTSPQQTAVEKTTGAWNVEDPDAGADAGAQTAMVKGHSEITKRAISYLADRGMLPPQLQSQEAQKLLLFGTAFGDHVYLGRPDMPRQFVPTVVDTYAPDNPTYGTYWPFQDCTVIHETSPSGTRCDGVPTHDHEFEVGAIDVDCDLRISGWNQWVAGKAGTDQPSTSLRLNLPVNLDCTDSPFWPDADTNKQVSFTQDNMFHYAYGDLDEFADQARLAEFDAQMENERTHSGSPDTSVVARSSLRVYPFDSRGYSELKSAMLLQTTTVGAGFGVAKYGAVLFQLARKFFDGGSAAPSLGELIHVGHGPGSVWSTGGAAGRNPFDMLSFHFPDTYLGGNPYICSNGGGVTVPFGPGFIESTDTMTGSTVSNPCANGRATWPVWVPESYSSDRPTWLARLSQERPGQRDAAALIYLGWASHMIQDASLPHHSSNWTGEEHDMQDSMGDIPDFYSGVFSGAQKQTEPMSTWSRPYRATYSLDGWDWQWGSISNRAGFDVTKLAKGSHYPWALDDILPPAVEELLGPESAPKSLYEICDVGLGVNNWMADGDLEHDTAYRSLFLPQAEAAFKQRVTFATEKDVRDYIKAAVIGTMKVILCAQPRPADPAVMAVLGSV